MDVIKDNPPQVEEELTNEERYLNYERYRILVQNEYLGGRKRVLLIGMGINGVCFSV